MKSRAGGSIDINPKESGPKWPPRITLLLDDNARVLSVNRDQAGTSFASISATGQLCLHRQLHPNCSGECRFNAMWRMAWASLTDRESVEWELKDAQIGRLLRLNLSTTPAPEGIRKDRRIHNKLLTITDITKYRREYETLLEKQKALIKLMLEKARADSADAGADPYDESGDTGNRLMAGFFKQDTSFGRQLILAQENERKRVASELHDGISQSIGFVKYKIEDGAARLTKENPHLDLNLFDAAIDELKHIVNEIRRISSNLAPSMLEDFGLNVALEWLCREFKNHNRELQVLCNACVDESATPAALKLAIYRIVQESLNNVAKHASASRVNVSLGMTDEGIGLTIADNGIGFENKEDAQKSSRPSGLGLRSMRERVEVTGGEFNFESEPGQGFVIYAKWNAADLHPIR